MLFVGMVATGPTGACIPAVGRGSGPKFGGFSEMALSYRFGGRSCYVAVEYLLAMVGFAFVVVGGLLWGWGRIRQSESGHRG
jgi:hypothetical protein